LEDSPWLGGADVGHNPIAERAAVLGSGVAGLFAARVLSDHFDEVVMIDRDDVPDGPRARDGVPQGKHFHALLPGGLNIVCDLFPDFTDDLEAAGAIRCVAGQDFFVFRPEGKSYALAVYQPEPRPVGTIYFMSRPLLEDCVRRRVEALPNVHPRNRCLVTEPLTNGERLTGVVVDDQEHLEADLVVDTTGRNARSVRWLGTLGYEAPVESVVNCDFAYASAVLRPADPDALGGAGFIVLPRPESQYGSRGAYLVRIEGDNWLAGLGGRFGDYPPANLDAWREFGRTLAWPIWDELVGTAELVTEPAPFRFPRSVRRHFERLECFPDGLVPLGDAVCHFNPLYGQGMSAAACQARALGQVLQRRARESQDLTCLAQEFFPEAYEVTRTPWALAAAADFQDARVTGDFPMEEIESLATLQVVAGLADTDPEAARFLTDIVTLARPLAALDEPPWPEKLGRESVEPTPS
jgi:2-polyprenyl-6-methoxyphenol hydroxylase-like FAD-dependent oxidoreductase